MKPVDFVLLAVIVLLLALAVRQIVVNRRRGKGCCGSCEGCACPCDKQQKKAEKR